MDPTKLGVMNFEDCCFGKNISSTMPTNCKILLKKLQGILRINSIFTIFKN
jgi:hypothetical protein